MALISSSVSPEVWTLEADGDSVGKLNWTDLTGLTGVCPARDFTVSITFRHLATVVEMAECWGFSQVEVVVVSITGVDVGTGGELGNGCKGLDESGG